MKKLIIAAFALTTAASVFAQGTINFNIRNANGTLHIWGPSSTTPSLSLIGNGPTDSPAGTTPYSTSGMALIGASGATGKFGYSTTFAQLLGLTGADQPESSLIPSTAATTFRSGTSLGGVANITQTLPGVAVDAAVATIEMVAWDNNSGLYPTWTQASVAWKAGLIAAGVSGPFNLQAIGGGVNTPPLPNAADGSGLKSFNLYTIPEPSTFALAGLGAAALMIFRRRK